MRGPLLPLACAVAVVAICLHRRRKQRLHLRLLEQPGLIFTGTGCSSGLPLVQCALQQSPSPSGCQSCAVALRRGRGDPNWRGNVGALLRFFNPATGRQLNLQIDCGKTFREVVTMEVYRKFGIKWLDALLLTHDHMDAIGGLDELRSLQMFDKDSREVSSSIRCMCDRRTLSRLRHVVPYLFPKPKRAAGAATAPFDPGLCQCCELDYEGPAREPQAASPDSALPRSCSSSTSAAATGDTAVLATPPVPVPVPVKRFVAKIDWDSWGATAADGQPQDETSTFDLCGLQITALPLQHGADCACLEPSGTPHTFTALLRPTPSLHTFTAHLHCNPHPRPQTPAAHTRSHRFPEPRLNCTFMSHVSTASWIELTCV